jgi:hypothetical protein
MIFNQAVQQALSTAGQRNCVTPSAASVAKPQASMHMQWGRCKLPARVMFGTQDVIALSVDACQFRVIVMSYNNNDNNKKNIN